MEILINAHRAGFAQGFVKLSCHKRPGRPLLAREVHRSLVALCSALARIPHFPSASSTLPRRSLGALALPPLVDMVPLQCSPAKRDGVASRAVAGLAPSQMPQQERPILTECAFRKPPSRARKSPMGSQRAWPWRPSSLLCTHVQMCVIQAALLAWAGQGKGRTPQQCSQPPRLLGASPQGDTGTCPPGSVPQAPRPWPAGHPSLLHLLRSLGGRGGPGPALRLELCGEGISEGRC